MIKLRNGHLILAQEIAARMFEHASYVHMAHYPMEGRLLLAPVDDDIFKSIHKCEVIFVKMKNARGDVALSIQPLIMDEVFDGKDRSLDYKVDEGAGVVQVFL